jgi:hypothetical protein
MKKLNLALRSFSSSTCCAVRNVAFVCMDATGQLAGLICLSLYLWPVYLSAAIGTMSTVSRRTRK